MTHQGKTELEKDLKRCMEYRQDLLDLIDKPIFLRQVSDYEIKQRLIDCERFIAQSERLLEDHENELNKPKTFIQS